MQVRIWISNSPEVVAPEAHRALESEREDPVVKTLNVTWNSAEDTFRIPTATVPIRPLLTKREVLKLPPTHSDL